MFDRLDKLQRHIASNNRDSFYDPYATTHKRLDIILKRKNSKLSLPKNLVISRRWMVKNGKYIGLCREGIKQVFEHFPAGFAINKENFRKLMEISPNFLRLVMIRFELIDEYDAYREMQVKLLITEVLNNSTINQRQYERMKKKYLRKIADNACDLLGIP